MSRSCRSIVDDDPDDYFWRSVSRSPGKSYNEKLWTFDDKKSRIQSRSRYRMSRSRSPSYSFRHIRSRSLDSLSDSERPGRKSRTENRNRCLGVFGMSTYTTERQIRDIFSAFGKLEDVQMIFDATTGLSRGFCFVYFESADDAKYAKEHCDGIDIDRRRVRVDFSITQRPHTPTPGVYMGKSNRYNGNRSDNNYRRRRFNDDYDGTPHYWRSPSPYRGRRVNVGNGRYYDDRSDYDSQFPPKRRRY